MAVNGSLTTHAQNSKTFTASAVDTCYTDEGSKKYCYQNFGSGNWRDGNDTCQALGGQLPAVFLAGKQQFLTK